MPARYEFGRWVFAADTGDLHNGETVTRLEPQVAKLLAHFIEHQHTVISRDELMAAVWENRIVSDDAINRCVSILRQVLSSEDKNAYIETVVRRGYLAHFPPPEVTTPPVTTTRLSSRYLVLAAVGAVLALALYIIIGDPILPAQTVHEPISSEPPLVAVLPFTSSSQTGDVAFFAAGIHDDLLTQLAKLQSIRVINAASVGEYRSTPHNIRQIGEELGADVILEGSVQVTTDRIHINAQLIDARSDEHLWAESYDRALSPADIFDVQSGIARAIAVELNTTLTSQDSQQLALIPTTNMAAYRAFHKAMQYRDKPGTNLNVPEYRQALEEAVALDPSFTRAWAALVSALAYTNMNEGRPELTLQAEQALEHLQAVAPGSPDQLIGQAAYVYYALKDYDRAHELVSLALAQTPGDFRAVQLRALIERRQGDFTAYLASQKDARRLNPRAAVMWDAVINGLLLTHRYDEAVAEIERAPLASYDKEYAHNLLLYRADRDPKRLQASMDELCQFYEVPDCGWLAHITDRDYAGALKVLESTPDTDLGRLGVSQKDRNRAFTYWLMKDDLQLGQLTGQWQGRLDGWYIPAAMLAGIQGRAGDAAQLIERWERQDPIDWAQRAIARTEACRVLGMIGATRSAVKCIREGLEEASLVMPFLEPYLPFYDAIRDQAEFITMVAEIDVDRPQ